MNEWQDLDAEKAEEEERIMHDVACFWVSIYVGVSVMCFLVVLGLLYLKEVILKW